MIRCNLAVLLAERSVKIVRMAEDTGISRTTLTALSTNKSTGIQYDTMEKICRYLRISPDDLFIVYPLDIDNIFVVSKDDIDLGVAWFNEALVTLVITGAGFTQEKFYVLAHTELPDRPDNCDRLASIKPPEIIKVRGGGLWDEMQKTTYSLPADLDVGREFRRIKDLIDPLPPQIKTFMSEKIGAALLENIIKRCDYPKDIITRVDFMFEF